MSHQSDNSKKLSKVLHHIYDINKMPICPARPAVILIKFPILRDDADAKNSQRAFQFLAEFCASLNEQSTVCLLTSPPDTAHLLPCLEKALRHQLSVAVKVAKDVYPAHAGQLPRRHAALLVMTRYRSTLRHTSTRIAYTYCPACGKTTKDYGGKKHIYHPYGTLLSDVWRDFECDPRSGTPELEDRLCDLFGLEPYKELQVFDMRRCEELLPPSATSAVREATLPLFRIKKERPRESRLINADCLEALKSVPSDTVDFCFADPPYNVQKQYDHWNDALETKHYFEWCDSWLTELARVLKPGRMLAVINIPQWSIRHYQHLSTLLDFQSWIAWDGLSVPVRMIMPSHYAILCFSKGEPRPLPGMSDTFLSSTEVQRLLPLKEFFCLRAQCIAKRNKHPGADRDSFSDLWYDIHRLKHNSRRVDHPCQLPPTLMRRLFALYTSPDEMILDCFDGAGTSTLVAHQMARRFIGIELSSKYHKIAEARHELIAQGEDPFAKQDDIPDSKNSRVERLPKQKYAISKKVLQLDVRKIAAKLEHLPTRAEVSMMSTYPIKYFDEYFVSWGEVCAAARHKGMSELPQKVRDRDLQLSLL